LITVPYGPWEYMSYDTYPHRAHIWNFDPHDIREMFGKKKQLVLYIHPFGQCQQLDESLGWHIVDYVVERGMPTGEIDMARKLRLQRPRQTVSANIICGPGAEETMHWCLRSIRHVVDDVILVDTGMTDEGRRVASHYPVTLVPGPDPKVVGFEAPRNEGLKHCRMDWVFWIDTDERLMDPERMSKYFRQNLFNGYGIRQHHFACDTQFKPDMPVRFFRRAPYQGKTMRWFGMIHEHPELGLNEGPGPTIIISDCHLAHVGYLTESIRRARFARNLPMLQRDIEAYPERLLQKHFIMRDNMLLVMYELQQNGGKVTDQIRARAEETIALYRQYFLGKPGYLNVDSLQYYSQAVGVLGRGFEVAFQIAAGKDSANPNGTEKYRYDTREDFETDIMRRAREVVSPFASAWY
jgi:glycosyltransferase involved in cell wall biosynthesis